jgi:hypothetical protein
MSKRKKRPLLPQRKRMNRPARLASARHWLGAFEGRNVVRGYARWFGVDRLCAVKELGLLGVAVDPEYVAMLERSHQEQIRTSGEARARRDAADEAHRRDLEDDADDNVAFVAGRTSAGFTYGSIGEEVDAPEDGDELGPHGSPALPAGFASPRAEVRQTTRSRARLKQRTRGSRE